MHCTRYYHTGVVIAHYIAKRTHHNMSMNEYGCHTTALGTTVLMGQLRSNRVSSLVLTLGPPTRRNL